MIKFFLKTSIPKIAADNAGIVDNSDNADTGYNADSGDNAHSIDSIQNIDNTTTDKATKGTQQQPPIQNGLERLE